MVFCKLQVLTCSDIPLEELPRPGNVLKGQLKCRNDIRLKKVYTLCRSQICRTFYLEHCKLFTKKLPSSYYTEFENLSFCFNWLSFIRNMGKCCRDVIELNDGESILVEFCCFFAPVVVVVVVCLFVCLFFRFFHFLTIPGSVIGRNRTICIWATFWTRIRIRWRRRKSP